MFNTPRRSGPNLGLNRAQGGNDSADSTMKVNRLGELPDEMRFRSTDKWVGGRLYPGEMRVRFEGPGD